MASAPNKGLAMAIRFSVRLLRNARPGGPRLLAAATAFTLPLAVLSAVSAPAEFTRASSQLPTVEALPAVTGLAEPERVELEDKRTASSRTWRNPDGSLQAEVFSAPVHYRDGAGDWRPIDNTLVPADQPGFVAENTANEYRLLVPNDVGDTPVRIQSEDGWVAFGPAGADGAPKINGPAAVMEGPAPGTRVEYRAMGEGVKETIILPAPPASPEPPSYDFEVTASPGLVPQLTADGGLRFVKENGAVVFVSPPPFMEDSAEVDGLPNHSTEIDYALQPNSQGWTLTVMPDQTWLLDPARVYPVMIDPTVTQQGADIDCWINQATPTTATCGGERIRVGLNSTGARRRGLLDFDIPSSIPLNATIDSAKLGLYMDAAQSLTTNSGEYSARRLTRGWTGRATWNTYNGTDNWTNPGGDYKSEQTGLVTLNGKTSGYKFWDVTDITSSWIKGTTQNYGFIVKQSYETTDNALAFYSTNTTDDTRWPKLTISYTPAAAEVFDKIGDRKFFAFEEQALNDRLTAKVNTANGNLLLSGNDLSVLGTGLGVELTRSYNSLSTDTGDKASLTAGWSMAGGPSERLLFPQGDSSRVVFQHGSGYRTQFDQTVGGGYRVEEPGLRADLERDDGTGEYRLKWFSKDTWVFNNAGELTARKDKNDNTINYTRDATGKLTKITDTRGREITLAYTGPAGLLSTITDHAGGRTLNYDYTEIPETPGAYRLTRTWMSSYALNAPDGNLNAETSYGYDSANRLTTITDPRGNGTTLTYEGTSRKISTLTRATPASTSVGDSTWTFTYEASLDNKCDDNTSATKQTQVDGPRLSPVEDLTTFCFDNHDRLVQTYDAKGHRRSTEYGTNSNVISHNESGVAGGTGPAFDYSYTNNNLTQVTLPQTGTATPGTATAQYSDTNANPHLPTAVYDFSNSKTGSPAWSYDYDDDGNLIEADAATVSSRFRYCYDAHGSLTRIDAPPVSVEPDNTTDGLNPSCTGNAQGNDTLLTYNTQGELITIDEPGPRRTTELTYDALSRVKTATDGRGVVSTFTYDAHDRILDIAYNDPSGTISGVNTVSYMYDTNGNMTKRSDAANATNFTFDELNRMTDENPESGVTSSTKYTYDEASNLLTMTVTSEPGPVTYVYDKLNLATQVTDQKGNQTTFGYDKQDRRETTTYPNGVVMKSKFDDARRLLCIYSYTGTAPTLDSDGCPSPAAGLVSLHKYTYTSNLGLDTTTRYSETNRTNERTNYRYDAIQRLTLATTKTNGGTSLTTGTTDELRGYTYTLDARGNVTRKTVTGSQVTNGDTTYAHADNNELCWTAPGTPTPDCATTPTGATTYTYDGAGNQTGSTATNGTGIGTGTYNKQNQTTSITPPGSSTPFEMEYADVTSDRRIRAGDTRMAYSLLGLTAQGPNGSTTHADLFVRDPNTTLVSRVNGGNNDNGALYYSYDGLGSVVATTDQTGTVQHRYTYDPYGLELNPASTDTNPWRYASGYHDKTTGLTKFGTRYQDPNLMRWTQTDPIAGQPSQPMTLNPYNYVGCNPTNHTDKSGRWLDEALEFAGAALMGYELEGVWDGGVTYEEAATFFGSELFGIGIETLCIGTVAGLTAGWGLVFASAGCLAAGEYSGALIEDLASD